MNGLWLREYTWILWQGKKLSSIWFANMELIYWSVCSSRMRGVDWVKGGDGGAREGGIVILGHG